MATYMTVCTIENGGKITEGMVLDGDGINESAVAAEEYCKKEGYYGYTLYDSNGKAVYADVMPFSPYVPKRRVEKIPAEPYMSLGKLKASHKKSRAPVFRDEPDEPAEILDGEGGDPGRKVAK